VEEEEETGVEVAREVLLEAFRVVGWAEFSLGGSACFVDMSLRLCAQVEKEEGRQVACVGVEIGVLAVYLEET
jgi:hypothetical protein